MKDLAAKNEILIEKLQKLLDYTLGYQVNIQSPKQVKELLYDVMKLPKRYKNGNLTTNEDALFTLIPHGGDLLKVLLNLRELTKRRSFFKLSLSTQGRMHTNFKPGGTITGRLSSSKSILGSGTNLQNQPKVARQMYIADPGHLLINADYSKAESWIVAYLANDENMIDALTGGGDFHKINASNILGIPIEEVGYKERQLGKRISHAANYMMTAHTFLKVMQKDGYKVTKAHCQHLLDRYFETYPRVRNLQDKVKHQMFNNMTLVNCFGRKVTFFAHKNDTLFRSACSWIPQGTVGDMTNRALVRIYHEIDTVDLLLQIHDAILMQARIELINQNLIDQIKECMAIPVRVNAHTIKIPVDVEIGPNWLNLVPWEEWKDDQNTTN
jgi:DNA polymerase-1